MSEEPGVPAQGAGNASGAPMSERMQALLSRAVEDQLSEQRQLASLVAEVRALLGALPAEIAAVAPIDETVRSDVTRVRAALASVEQRLEVLTAAVQRPADTSEVIGGVDAVGQKVDALEVRLGGMESRLADLLRVVAEMSSTSALAESRIGTRVDEAVLALAEVMVRRGKSGPAQMPPASASEAREATVMSPPLAAPAAPVMSPPLAAMTPAPTPVPAPLAPASPSLSLAKPVQDPTPPDVRVAEVAPAAARVDDGISDTAADGEAAEAVDVEHHEETPGGDGADEVSEQDDEAVENGDTVENGDAEDVEEADEDAEDDDDDEDEEDEDDEDEDEDDEDADDEDADEVDDADDVEPAVGSDEPIATPADTGPPAAPAPDPWTTPSPFQPGPPRERGESGAAAALAELQAGEESDGSSESQGTQRRRPWWRPGD